MRNFLLFILISASNLAIACGFGPLGEDTRFSLLNPRLFGYYQYGSFYYSTYVFGPLSDTLPTFFTEPNVALWYDYCRGKVDIASVHSAVYKLTDADISSQSPNAMIQYLYRKNDTSALNYLRFAKICEYFNSWEDDPWEREENFAIPKRTELMERAAGLSAKVKNKEIRKRYTFLAIRLAWYNRQYDKVQSFFAGTFEKTNQRDILYYWSLYFKSISQTDSARTNFELAQVFAHAADKRFACHQHYRKSVPVEQALQYAKTNEEKANVYLLAAIEKYDKALPYLEKIYQLNPACDGLAFLVLREINKIEDYVMTPYYTLFQPSLSYDYWSEQGDDVSIEQTLNRAEADRKYAGEVLAFISSVNLKKVNNPFMWETGKAYLQFITREYDPCLALISRLEKSTSDNKLVNQLQIIKALALTSKQKQGAAVIPTAIQPILMTNNANRKFIFAIGKELEYLGNTTDAALLYSIVYDKTSGEDYVDNYVIWKALPGGAYNDFFTDYFDYTDVVYTPAQIQDLIDDVEKNKGLTDIFSVFKYRILGQELPRLYDLLGTKYIRRNRLNDALGAFEKAGKVYWSRAYTAWDDSWNIFDRNPFYTLKYTPGFIETTDTIRLNKYTVTKQLIKYLAKAEDKHEPDRDYYYFLVANAYYNMGTEGNAYMMRRFTGWSSYELSAFEDEAEFRQSNLAKHYYLKALEYAQTDKFRALCLRMAVRCENHKLEYQYAFGQRQDNSDTPPNQYYMDLQRTYPKYFEPLVSNCDCFEEYFKARR